MRKIDFEMWKLDENPSIQLQFQHWLRLQERQLEDWRSCDCSAQGIELLVRNYTNGITSSCMTIATVRLPNEIQNKGVFKSILNYLAENSPWDVVAIEDVSNPNLRNFCVKYGFQPVSPVYSNSFYINKNQLPKFQVEKFRY